MKTIRWGILGLGKIANSFATDMQIVEGSEVYAVASRSQEKADEFGAKYKAVHCYDSYEKLAQDPNVDAIYIATPHVRHHEDTLLCLKHGKGVLCEKPFAMNLGQVEEMIATAKQHKVLLMEALWTRFMPHFKFVQDELASGKYGAVKTLTADFCFDAPFNPEGRLYNKDLGGGSLLDIGIYPAFLALAMLGKPETISAKAKIGKTGVDEETEMTFTYASGTKAHLASSIKIKTPSLATFVCENGMIIMQGQFHMKDKVTTVLDGVKVDHDFGYKAKGYHFEIMHFADLLRADKKESPIMTYDFSRTLIHTLDTVRQQIGLEYDLKA
ncbi:Gfo/Idh/MocA family protein [Leeuwenhoekiella parthenopeia]|uniref:Gfo/Idh/MocA family oxidoreductase n=1 Tax=Leeuwenhoekiella parthenopeia TaxID=2890320 RepID=A0ABS8GX97_9FLAO|nr:Gfo/Idh/MocA family oxidoreductase [Leeuwenhoekiella parthenopeia]MCC4214635.1 Gfo/Idh/MocA family oxidoreductase [Leeuwenhoekiella parthenopeia]